MDLAEVTVGVEDGGGELATCGRAMRRRTAVAQSRQRRQEGGSGSDNVRKVEREVRQSWWCK